MKDKLSELEQFKFTTIGSLRASVRMPNKAEAFIRAVQTIVYTLGFSNFSISYVGIDSSADVPLSTTPASLLQTYFAEKMYEGDFASEYLDDAISPIYHSDIYQYLSQSPYKPKIIERTFLINELMHNYFFYDALCCPLTNYHSNRKIIFCILSEGEKPNEFKRQTLDCRAKIIYLANIANSFLPQLLSVAKAVKKNKSTLTKRQKDVLYALIGGMTQAEAAAYLGLRHLTVETYCKEIRQRLGAPTTIAAVGEAIRLGEISIEGRLIA
jgi:DNA-binding CsgD family transcriptional regulator